MTDHSVIALAGAGGDLGARITKALVARGATVHAIVRRNLPGAELTRITALGALPVAADPADVADMAAACAGASCVISALNGLREVMIDRQSVLLQAAVLAGVPRFIPSDFSADFAKTRPGRNRNFDLRREFMEVADKAPIKVTSILNGAFLDMLGTEMPIIQPRIHCVLYWHDSDQLLDFTTKDNVASYTAAAAMDPSTPRYLRIAGGSVSVRQIAANLTEISGIRYRSLWVGSLGTLGMTIKIAKRFAPQSGDPFPAWQGMQYMHDMFSGDAKLMPVDNDRYAGMNWTTVSAHIARLNMAI